MFNGPAQKNEGLYPSTLGIQTSAGLTRAKDEADKLGNPCGAALLAVLLDLGPLFSNVDNVSRYCQYEVAL